MLGVQIALLPLTNEWLQHTGSIPVHPYMSGIVKGYKPHKRPHKGCIGWYYCKRTDRTHDIGSEALIPGKKGYLCDCGYYTRLDPFNHEVHYYDENNKGVVYDDVADFGKTEYVKQDVGVMFWTGRFSEAKTCIIQLGVSNGMIDTEEMDKIGVENGWYAWSVFINKANVYNGGIKE